MIFHSQPLSEFVLIRANSWLIHSHRPKTPYLPILPSWPLVLLPLIPSAFPPFVSLCLSGYAPIMQNKPNFKMGNINISTARTKAYAKEQRTMNNEHYRKQTQSNPKLSPPRRNPALSEVEGTRHEPCTTAAGQP